VTHLSLPSTPASSIRARTWCAPCSTASAPTAPWAPTRTRSRSSARTRPTTRRATSSTTRRSRAHHGLAPALRPASRSARTYLIAAPTSSPATSSSSSSARRAGHAPRRAPPSCSTAPWGPSEVWDKLPARAAGDHRQEAQALRRSTLLKVAPRRPAWAGASTPSCRRASSPSRRAAARRGRSPRSRTAIEKTYGKRGESRRRSELRRGRRHARQPARGAGAPGRSPSDAPPAADPGPAPDFVQRVTAMMLAGKGDLLPVSAFPVDGTFPTGTGQWEKRNIAQEIPVWDPALCIQCNKCALVCPHAAIRMPRSTAEALAGAPAGFKAVPVDGKELPGTDVHRAGRARGLHRLRPLRRGLPGQGQARSRAQGHQHGAAAPLREPTRQLRLLPRAARGGPAAERSSSTSRARSCCSRCSSTRAPAPAAARRPTSSC
jgi:ferredoxin